MDMASNHWHYLMAIVATIAVAAVPLRAAPIVWGGAISDRWDLAAN